MYRAKVTTLVTFLNEEMRSRFMFCKDAKDTYIEVADENAAEVLEEANRNLKIYMDLQEQN